MLIYSFFRFSGGQSASRQRIRHKTRAWSIEAVWISVETNRIIFTFHVNWWCWSWRYLTKIFNAENELNRFYYLGEKVPSSPLKIRGRQASTPQSGEAKSVVGDHRHRKTEKEEDEELLQESKRAEKGFRFEKNPWCKWCVNFSTITDTKTKVIR